MKKLVDFLAVVLAMIVVALIVGTLMQVALGLLGLTWVGP